jgi:hypothetical protein
MRKLFVVCVLVCACFLLTSRGSVAWPFPSNPQCAPVVACSQGCAVPTSSRCSDLFASMVDDGTAVACVDGDGADGVCLP